MRSRRYYVVTMSNYPVVAISVLVFRANTPSPSDYRGLRERRELPHRGPGAALPRRKTNLVHFDAPSRQLPASRASEVKTHIVVVYWTSVREYVFFSKLKKRVFLRFLEMTCQET